MESRTVQPTKPSAPIPSGRYAAMQSKDWFFCQIETRDMAENELRNAIEGDFIVRPSESSRGEGSLSISVKGKLKNKHFKEKVQNISRTFTLPKCKKNILILNLNRLLEKIINSK